MKTRLLNDEILEFTNQDDLLEFFFSSKLGKFCLMFNAKMMHTSKNFPTTALNKLCAKHGLTLSN